jgi:hypothetical protein
VEIEELLEIFITTSSDLLDITDRFSIGILANAINSILSVSLIEVHSKLFHSNKEYNEKWVERIEWNRKE